MQLPENFGEWGASQKQQFLAEQDPKEWVELWLTHLFDRSFNYTQNKANAGVIPQTLIQYPSLLIISLPVKQYFREFSLSLL